VGVLIEEAREIFPGAVVPRDFDTIEIPFPERGSPELIRFSDRTVEDRIVEEQTVDEHPLGGPALEEPLADPS
jgi:hypothetical protein